ncbi:MAG: hypothetical protein KRP56_02835 [Candidatus Methanogranum gryphiswaldense]|nr:MAG: hypothetical protein KRP56_02835 [Candidatus Methanogranum sp. U3.2.1]
MDTREAGNRVIKAVCRGDRTDLVLNPLMALIVIFAFIVFSVYYMVIVHDIQGYANLPFLFSFTVFILVIIASFMPLIISAVLLIRNKWHSKREEELRAAIIDYLDACQKDAMTLKDRLEKMMEIDDSIRRDEHPSSPWKIIYLMILGIAVSLFCWSVFPLSEHLGEVSYVLIIEFLFIGIVAFPSITLMPYKHERHFIEFYEISKSSFSEIGIELNDFSPTINYMDYNKMRRYSLMTLGIFSIYWAYLCLRSMNKHFLSHKKMEFILISSIKKKETERMKNQNFDTVVKFDSFRDDIVRKD